jgi:formate-dependent nitrite reductase membrane component NrfD
MNVFVADPEWGWWIVLYFYIGGIAAGAYFLATLVELFGSEEDLPLARIGFRLAFPLICLCGFFLTIDLERPERFWHMLFQSEVVDHALEEGSWGELFTSPMLKWWSPMSIGAWAITVFGLCSGLSFLGTLWPESRPARWLTRGVPARVFQVIGCCVGFFVASYTGVLLTASNQPVWSVSTWIGPLFLASAASTSIAAVMLLGRWFGDISAATEERLEKADLWALGLELFLFLIFLASLGPALPFALRTPAGLVLVVGTLVLGLLVPLVLHLGLGESATWRMPLAAWSCLVGGLLLRYGVVRTPAEILASYGGQEEAALASAVLLASWEGIGLVVVTLALAVAIPLVLWRHWRLTGGQTALAGVVSVLVLVGVGYYATAWSGPEGDNRPLAHVSFSPEIGRPRGGGVGASGSNRPTVVRMRSKFNATP